MGLAGNSGFDAAVEWDEKKENHRTRCRNPAPWYVSTVDRNDRDEERRDDRREPTATGVREDESDDSDRGRDERQALDPGGDVHPENDDRDREQHRDIGSRSIRSADRAAGTDIACAGAHKLPGVTRKAHPLEADTQGALGDHDRTLQEEAGQQAHDDENDIPLSPNLVGHVEKKKKSLQEQNELEDTELTILGDDERKGRHADVRDQRERWPEPKRMGTSRGPLCDPERIEATEGQRRRRNAYPSDCPHGRGIGTPTEVHIPVERNVEDNDRKQDTAQVAHDERHDRGGDRQQEEGSDGSGRHMRDEEADHDGEQSSCRGVPPETPAERRQARRPRGVECMLAHLVSSPPVRA